MAIRIMLICPKRKVCCTGSSQSAALPTASVIAGMPSPRRYRISTAVHHTLTYREISVVTTMPVPM